MHIIYSLLQFILFFFGPIFFMGIIFFIAVRNKNAKNKDTGRVLNINTRTREYTKIPKYKKTGTNALKTRKSIFDNYKSVMDNFKK